jgi:hypothetical protein
MSLKTAIARWRQFLNQSSPLKDETVLFRGDVVQVGEKHYVIERGCMGAEFLAHLRAADAIGKALPKVLRFPDKPA